MLSNIVLIINGTEKKYARRLLLIMCHQSRLNDLDI